MKTFASGTIITGKVVDITADSPPPAARPRIIWHVSRRAFPTGYFEARPWFLNLTTREYHEGSTVVLACSVAGARRLMPTGLENVDSDGLDGCWFAPPRAAAGAQPRAALPSMPIKTLEGSAA